MDGGKPPAATSGRKQIVTDGYRKPGLSVAILAVAATACGSQPNLEVGMTTQMTTLEETAKCQYIGYTKAGITEKNATVTATENGPAIDEKLVVAMRNLASEIGADTVVPIYEDDAIVKEFRLYICKAKNSAP